MSVERQQGSGYQMDLFDEALMKALRPEAPGDGGTVTGTNGGATSVDGVGTGRKPPWCVERMPGCVGGGDREEPASPIF